MALYAKQSVEMEVNLKALITGASSGIDEGEE